MTFSILLKNYHESKSNIRHGEGHIQECLRRIGGGGGGGGGIGKPDEKGREDERGRKTYTRSIVSKMILSSICDKETCSLT